METVIPSGSLGSPTFSLSIGSYNPTFLYLILVSSQESHVDQDAIAYSTNRSGFDEPKGEEDYDYYHVYL